MIQTFQRLKKKKITEITDHNHDNYIATPKFNKSRVETFAARFGKKRQILTLSWKKLTQTNQNMYLLKMNLKSQKLLIQAIFEVKTIF